MKPRIISLLEHANSIAIFSHVNPDADALGSSLAFKHIINENYWQKDVDIFVDGEIGELYKPLLKEQIINPRPLSEYDLAIVLDCPNIERTGKFAEMISSTPSIINIDHHETNKRFGEVNYVTPQVSSTCEMLFLLSQKFGLKINDLIAKQLYQGIITDTNCFSSTYSSNLTHKVVSELLKYDFDANKIKEYYFKNNSRAKTRLLASAIQSMEFYYNNRLTTMKIDYPSFSKVNASFEDTLGIIDNGISVRGTEVSAILIEKLPQCIYCSLRSKGNVDVGEVAKQFGGGGSKKISAFQSYGEIQDIEERLVDFISPLLENSFVEEDFTF